MTAIKAIETRYAGCRFRSRLEARWAVFFDALGIRWEYEPEGFELGDGERYLPDFWLPDSEKWVEVKGPYPGAAASLDKVFKLANGMMPGVPQGEPAGGNLGVAPIRIVSEIPRHLNKLGTIECLGPCGTQMPWWLPPGQDSHLVFGLNPNDPDHYEEVPPGWVIWRWIKVHWVLDSRQAILAAIQAARSARFEHGESG